MRLEGEDNAGKAKLFSQGLGAFDHGHMAAMNAIEIADRGDRAVEPRRRRCRINGDDETFGGGRIGQGNRKFQSVHGNESLEHVLN